MKNLSGKFASALSKRGIKKGDVVAILAPNIPEFAIVFLGVLQLGAILTCVNPHFTSEELIKQLKVANARCIVAVHQLVHRAKEAEEELDMSHVFVIGEDDECESVSVLLNQGETDFSPVRLNPKEDLAILPFSSGSGGLPKGVMTSHYNLTAFGCIANSEGFLNFDENSKILATVPFYRAFGLVAVLSLSLHRGSTLVSVPRFDQTKLFNLLQDNKVSACSMNELHVVSTVPPNRSSKVMTSKN